MRQRFEQFRHNVETEGLQESTQERMETPNEEVVASWRNRLNQMHAQGWGGDSDYVELHRLLAREESGRFVWNTAQELDPVAVSQVLDRIDYRIRSYEVLRRVDLLLQDLSQRGENNSPRYLELMDLTTYSIGDTRQWKDVRQIDMQRVQELLNDNGEVNSQEAIQAVESIEKSQENEKPLEQRKNPEELWEENIERLTREAKLYISELKGQKQLELAKARLDETASPNQPEESEPEETEVSLGQQEKKRGAIGRTLDRMSDWLIKRDFKKAGIEDPQKALEFYHYIREEIDPDFSLESSSRIDILKHSLDAIPDPINFYRALKEVINIKRVCDPNDNSSSSIGFLMKEPDIFRKIDLFKSVRNTLKIKKDILYPDDFIKFCRNEKLQARLSPENLDKIERLLSIREDKVRIDELSILLDIVENQNIFRSILEIINEKESSRAGVSIKNIAQSIESLEKDGMLDKVLIGADMHLGIPSAIDTLTSAREKGVEKLGSLGLEMLRKDPEFKNFSDDFSVLAGRKFHLREFDELVELYTWHKEYALAYFEALRKLGVFEEEKDKGSGFDIQKISDIIGYWKNKTTALPEAFYAIVDPEFQNKIARFRKIKQNFKEQDIFDFAIAYAEYPEFIDDLEKPDGIELYEFFSKKGINTFASKEFFKVPGFAKTLKALDEYVIIENRYSLTEIFKLHNDKAQVDTLISFLKELFSTYQHKYFILQIPQLINRAEFWKNHPEEFERHKKVLEVARTFSNILNIDESKGEQLEMPQEHLSFFREFKERYKVGDKGETIMNLIVIKESKRLLESKGEFSWEKVLEGAKSELEKYQEVIENHNFDKIPEGLQATIGMEYEITGVIKEAYEKTNALDFKSSITGVSDVAKVGQGNDAVHEIATQPTNNPYLMLLEMKLLQDLGYIDFNFRPQEQGGYYGSATGYHLSIGGEYGVNDTGNAKFLSNTISISNWGGVNFEKEVAKVGRVRSRGTDSENILLLEAQSPSIELRNFSIDRWEPFERTILTCYNSAIAIQAVERYTTINSHDQIVSLQKQFPSSSDEMMIQLEERNLIKERTGDPIVKELIFHWLKLQSGIIAAIEDHNENFLTNETDGYVDDKTGSWIESSDVSGRNNRRYFQEGLRNLNKNQSEHAQYQNLEDFFEKRLKIEPTDLFEQPDPNVVNAITYTGNLFLTKFSNFSKAGSLNQTKKADPNVIAFLTNTRENGVKNERRRESDVEKSVFDREGELPQDYYYLQGGSEKLIIHQTQKLFLEFNKQIANLLNSKSEGADEPRENLAIAA